MKMRLSICKKVFTTSICLGMSLAVIGTTALPKTVDAAVSASEERIECDGFDTPEEAITAFCEALKENDFDKAVSTFAIESYCDHYDSAGKMQSIGVVLSPFDPGNNMLIAPAENESLRRLNVGLRSADVLSKIYYPLLYITLADPGLSDDPFVQDAAESMHELKPFMALKNPYSDFQTLVSEIQQFPDFSQMEISKPVSPASMGFFSKVYLSSNNLNNIMKAALINGASGVTELGVVMEDDKDIYYLTMNVVKYNDKWYNCSFGGNIMMLMGTPQITQGIIGGPKEQIGDEIKNLLGFDDEVLRAGLLKELVPEFETFRDTFADKHDEYTLQMQSKAESHGLTYDPAQPWIDQLDVLKKVADLEGEHFYKKDYISIYAMTFEELLEFFSEEELAPFL